jgi:hypothetical protein
MQLCFRTRGRDFRRSEVFSEENVEKLLEGQQRGGAGGWFISSANRPILEALAPQEHEGFVFPDGFRSR